jgi:hypothetical protein
MSDEPVERPTPREMRCLMVLSAAVSALVDEFGVEKAAGMAFSAGFCALREELGYVAACSDLQDFVNEARHLGVPDPDAPNYLMEFLGKRS